ncbi:MAG: YciI family protein [Bauldia sp.]
MAVFFFRLTPPRPTFPGDMTDAEAAAMQAHFGYWADLCARGSAVAYGPVPEGAGAWGPAVIEATDQAEAAAIVAGDPAVRSGLGFTTDLVAMPDALIRPRAAAKAA